MVMVGVTAPFGLVLGGTQDADRGVPALSRCAGAGSVSSVAGVPSERLGSGSASTGSSSASSSTEGPRSASGTGADSGSGSGAATSLPVESEIAIPTAPTASRTHTPATPAHA